MIKLKIEYNIFKKQFEKKIIQGQNILEQNISNPEIIEQKIDDWEKDIVSFLKENIVNLPEKIISNIENVREESHLSFYMKGAFFKKNPSDYIEYLSTHLERKISAFKMTDDYLFISGINSGMKNPKLNTIQEKILFVLQKLYKLYNDDYYSVSIIFQVNGIEFRESEPDEIAENLQKRGYATRITSRGSKDLLKISVKGATYIERKNKSSKKKNESEINEKIDLVLIELKKLGFGQEIIFNEIEELRSLSKNLNKKNWSEVIKGKVFDMAFSELISKDVASFIYESLVDDKFKLLK